MLDTGGLQGDHVCTSCHRAWVDPDFVANPIAGSCNPDLGAVKGLSVKLSRVGDMLIGAIP